MESILPSNRKYILTKDQLHGDTNTVDLVKGSFDDSSKYRTANRDDAIYLSLGLFVTTDILLLICSVIPDFDEYTCGTEVTPEDWRRMKENALDFSTESQQILAEADAWVQTAFNEYGCFSFFGV